MTSFGLDFDDDEDCWLTPSVKDVAVQSSKPFDIKEYLGDVKLSDSAATLSKKIAKYTKKRATLERMSSLASVKEESPSGSSACDESSFSRDISSGLGVSIETENSSIAGFSKNVSSNKNVLFSLPTSQVSPSMDTVEPQVAFPFSSTPKSTLVEKGKERKRQMLISMLSPISSNDCTSMLENLAIACENEDEVFYDAEDDFSDEAIEAISLTASFSSIESIIAGRNENGQSCVRTGMTQSLIKVDEEEIPNPISNLKPTVARQARSSSVSPRPITSIAKAEPINTRKSEEVKLISTPLSSRNGTLRRSLGEQALSRSHYSALLKPTPSDLRLPRNPRVMKSNTLSISPNNVQISPNERNSSRNSLDANSSRPVSRASPILREELNRDLQHVTSLAQQQEDALRQAVKNLNSERKYSWQGDPNISHMSPHSSAGSLASSKSVDIAVLNKSIPSSTPNSRIPGPSRLPRRTAIPIPTKIQPNPRQNNSPMAKHGGDPYDDCF